MKKKKNKDYSKYEHIPKDFYERTTNVMNEFGFTQDDMKHLMKDIVRIKNIKSKKLRFDIYMIPEGASRPKYNGRRQKFYVPNASNNTKMFNRLLDEIGRSELIYTACKLDIKCYMPIPSGITSKNDIVLCELGFIRPLTKPDWDNVGKTTDMMTGSVWLDDSLIVDGRVRKYYSLKPRLEIKIEYFESFDSKYNKRNVTKSKRFNELYEQDLIKIYHDT